MPDSYIPSDLVHRIAHDDKTKRKKKAKMVYNCVEVMNNDVYCPTGELGSELCRVDLNDSSKHSIALKNRIIGLESSPNGYIAANTGYSVDIYKFDTDNAYFEALATFPQANSADTVQDGQINCTSFSRIDREEIVIGCRSRVYKVHWGETVVDSYEDFDEVISVAYGGHYSTNFIACELDVYRIDWRLSIHDLPSICEGIGRSIGESFSALATVGDYSLILATNRKVYVLDDRYIRRPVYTCDVPWGVSGVDALKCDEHSIWAGNLSNPDLWLYYPPRVPSIVLSEYLDNSLVGFDVVDSDLYFVAIDGRIEKLKV